MPQETCFIPVDVSAGSSPSHLRNSGRWIRRKSAKSDTFKCHVYLPDDSDFYHLVPKRATGRELLDYVFWRIDLREKEYFGLKFDNTKGMKIWLDPTKKIRKQISKKFLQNSDTPNFIPCDFFLQVKYFTPEPSNLREEFTRYLFFLHIHRDILEGKLPCSQHHAARLFSYSLQSQLGDYDPAKHTAGYTSKFIFIPGQTNELERAVAEHHKERKGMIQSDAEIHFLTYTVLNLEFYGLDSYPVTGHNKENLQLGLAPSGIKIYKDWKMIAFFAWGRVLKVSQKRKRLSLVVKNKLGSEGSEEKFLHFELDSKILCEVLYDNLIDYLQFYRMRLNLRESRDASRMLAKFRYSTRFMKRDQDTHVQSQIIQHNTEFRVSTPGLCANNEDYPVRSLSVNADVEATFQKSKSIGGYGDRREHPDIPSLTAIASETQLPFRTINTSLPPQIPPKTLRNELTEVSNGRRSVSPKGVVLGGKAPLQGHAEKVKLEESPTSPTAPTSATPFYRTAPLQTGSFDSTDSHSNETRSSTASPPSPRYTTLQISRFLSHESPVEVRRFKKENVNVEALNGGYSVVKKERLNSNQTNEQRHSLMLDPPEDFANKTQTKPSSSSNILQTMDTNKQSMIDQYLSSYTTNSQSKEVKIDSIPPPPPRRISSFVQSPVKQEFTNPPQDVPISDSSRETLTKNTKQILLDEIKQRLETVKMDKPQRPPPIKPKKRYNISQIPPNELENPHDIVITPDTALNSKVEEREVVRSSPVVPNEEFFDNRNKQLEEAKINLLEDITHELETRNTNSKDTQRQYLNMDFSDKRKKSHFTHNINDTPPPTPPVFKTSPRQVSKSPHPTRATHSYTTQGLILSDPNPINAKTLGKSKSMDAPFEQKENNLGGLEPKRSKTPAALVEQMALYKQRSLTKTLDLEPRSETPTFVSNKIDFNQTFEIQPTELNRNFEINNPVQSLPQKSNFQMNYNQQNTSLPPNFINGSNTSFHPITASAHARPIPKQPYQQPQNLRNFTQKTMGYRENSTTGTYRNSPTSRLQYSHPNFIQNSQYYTPPNTFPYDNTSKTFNYNPTTHQYPPMQQDIQKTSQNIQFQQTSENTITHWV